jgi:predicted metal-dependent hydrolase
LTTEIVTLAGRVVPYTLTISHRARQPRLIIAPGAGLRVVTPRGYDRRRLLIFILHRQRWINKHLDRIAAMPVEPTADSPLPESIPFLGVAHAVCVCETPGTRVSVAQTGGALIVRAPAGAAARPALEGWLRARARVAIVSRVEARAKEMGLIYGRVAIRDQQTRWGSCSQPGNLNFNWRLLLAPPAVLDYVVVHELAHRVEMNHSTRFWRIVAHYCPDFATHRTWLREHGRELRF